MFGGKLPSLGADGIPKLLDLLVFRINARSQLKIEASITFQINRNNCDIRWAARAAER